MHVYSSRQLSLLPREIKEDLIIGVVAVVVILQLQSLCPCIGPVVVIMLVAAVLFLRTGTFSVCVKDMDTEHQVCCIKELNTHTSPSERSSARENSLHPRVKPIESHCLEAIPLAIDFQMHQSGA